MSNKFVEVEEISTLEKIAAEYTKPDPGRMVDKKILSLIADRVLPWVEGPEVLEMGFGDDEWTSRIVEKVGHSNVVDASRKLLDVVAEKYGNSVVTYESLFETFVPDKKFDTIIASFVLEHVEDPVQVLRKSLEWLSHNGKLIAIVPHADSLHRRLAVVMGFQHKTSDLGETDGRMGHRRVYDVAAFARDIKEAGFEIELQKGLFTKLLPQSMMSNFSDQMLSGFMELGEQLPIEYATSLAFVCRKG